MCIGKRQTVLFSATQTRNVDDLARISLKKTPMYVGVDDHRDTATVEGLEQVSITYVTKYFCSPKLLQFFNILVIVIVIFVA